MAVAGQRTEPLAPLFRIGKLDELWLEIDLPQEHLKEIRLHDRVYLDVYETDARITHIGQNISSGSQSVLLRAIIEKPGDRIKPGQFVSVQLMHASSDDLLRLPVAALIHQDGKDYVFVRVANGYAPRAVSVASRESRQVLIHEGLKPTDEVVVQGVAALKASWVGIGSDE
jgi:cobalt-zinc-cadmium efflux system membrane fusion protein